MFNVWFWFYILQRSSNWAHKKIHMKWILCLLASYSVAHISDARTCSIVDEQLLWACVITGYDANPHYPGHGHYQLKIVKASYWQQGEQVWQHDAPDRIKNISGVFMMG